MSKPKGRLSHEQRRKRRAEIAVAVRNGATLSATARRFRVSIPTVREACREHGVQWES